MAYISVRVSAFFLLLVLSGQLQQSLGYGVGINYGQIANNLPSPTKVVSLLQSLSINKDLQSMTDPNKAMAWLKEHVQPHLPQTKITSITVGNEILNEGNTELMQILLPAMQTVHEALVALGLNDQINVTTAHSLTIMGNSFPPSSGSFKQDYASYILPILSFHAQIKTPFLINAYPYFAYKANPSQVPLEYVLFEPNQGMTDPNTNLNYDNMLYAQIDAVYSAIKALGHTDIDVRISETGWPSKGGSDEVGATPENAGLYNGNLLKRIAKKEGTPMKPSEPVDIYVFALFNENLKTGPDSERNYGLFYPDGTPVYSIGQQEYLPQFSISSASLKKVTSGLVFLSLTLAFLI
ncbi:glucan endo-1,3-beta-glucosidase 14-like isoform X2 [Aristolochia californica]|uniref:glucan endo-1,3-beta-glucosidase 14-like isoform X2 n=1 Tax=Aristolochia californica TaxID=171875 RepID=UPI0035DAF1E2